MYTSEELRVEGLNDQTRFTISQNISEHEEVIICYLMTDKGLLGTLTGVALLTDQRLFAWGLLFDIYKLNPGWLSDNAEIDRKESQSRRYQYNLKYFSIDQVYTKKDMVCVGLGYNKELRIRFQDTTQAEKFSTILQKAKTESTAYGRSWDVKKVMQGPKDDAPQSSAPDDSIKDIADQLMKLLELRKSGILSDEEFEAAKRKLLG